SDVCSSDLMLKPISLGARARHWLKGTRYAIRRLRKAALTRFTGELRIVSPLFSVAALVAAVSIAAPAAALELDFSGSIGVESRLFFQSPRFASQSDASGSFAFQPEFYAAWADGYQSLLFIPFLRLDQNDARRTHADIRELSYIYASNAFEL